MVVSIFIDGAPVRSYQAPYVARGRVMAPLVPFVLDVAASIELDGETIVVRRGDRFSQIPAAAFVPIGPLLRDLGVDVTYDAPSHRLLVHTPRAPFATPTPFNPAVPSAAPRAIFTPTPAVTPRPVVTGSPTPRRTPLPFTTPQSRPNPSLPSPAPSPRAAPLRRPPIRAAMFRRRSRA